MELGRFWWAIAARWWLVVLCVVLGVVIGYLISLGGGRVFQAKATVYLGQPLAPTGNAPVQTLATNPAAVSQIVKSEEVLHAVADAVGVQVDALRRAVSTKAVAGANAKAGQTSLVEVSVRGPWRRQSAEAANLLAAEVVERVSAYPAAKIEKLEVLLAAADEQLASVDAAIDAYQGELGSSSALDPAERLTVVGLLNSAVTQRAELIAEKTQAQLELSVAEDVEHAAVVTQAAASKVAARSRQSSMVVGAVIGLIVGIVLAVAWEPVRRRISPSPST